jgi:hypothetical protein
MKKIIKKKGINYFWSQVRAYSPQPIRNIVGYIYGLMFDRTGNYVYDLKNSMWSWSSLNEDRYIIKYMTLDTEEINF